MPIIDNPRQEAFAQHLVTGHAQIEAYRLAGYGKPSDAVASRLSRNIKVVARVAELRAHTAEKYEITLDLIARQLDEDRALAFKCDNPSAAVAATVAKGKLAGLFVEKATLAVSHNYSAMSEQEIRLELAALAAEARSLKPGVRH